MATLEERLQKKREPIDNWSVREQLVLAEAVARSGDQNWMSVSRTIKPFAEKNRPPDWFSQKNCAAQYGSLLETVEAPKRKKRTSSSSAESIVETPSEIILKRLREEYRKSLDEQMRRNKEIYLESNRKLELLISGGFTEEMMDQLMVEIDEYEAKKEKESLEYAEWLKSREALKLENERVFRPTLVAQKRKLDETVEIEETKVTELKKPALSPLLTSLLKTPSHVPNVTSSILHSAITQRDSSPTITSLLNTSATVPVSSTLQQLVTTAISQEPIIPPLVTISNTPKPETTEEKQQEPVKIVEKPEETVVEKPVEKEEKVEPEVKEDDTAEIRQLIEELQEKIDHDFDNNSKTSNEDKEVPPEDEPKEKTIEVESSKTETIEETPVLPPPTPVSIPEKDPEDDTDTDKEINKEVSDIIRDMKHEPIYAQKEEDKPESTTKKDSSVYDEYDFDDLIKPVIDKPKLDEPEPKTPDFSESYYDNLPVEVKLEKSGKAKRDYSRTKKKEDIDILLTDKVESEVEEIDTEKDQDSDKKSDKSSKVKDERSNSSWTEEEEVYPKSRSSLRLSRRSVTPSESINNSLRSTPVFDDDRDYRTWKKSVMLVYSRLAQHKNACLFLKPITDDKAPNYSSLIYRPMDLGTIRKNIENGNIRTTAEFKRDVLLMFYNAIMYNKRNTIVYDMALQMQQEAVNQIDILVQAQTQEMLPRRETRTSESSLKRKRDDKELPKFKKRRNE